MQIKRTIELKEDVWKSSLQGIKKLVVGKVESLIHKAPMLEAKIIADKKLKIQRFLQSLSVTENYTQRTWAIGF